MRTHQRILLVSCWSLLSNYSTKAFQPLIISKTSRHRTQTSRHPLLLVPESKEQHSTDETVPSILFDVPLADASIPLEGAVPAAPSPQETSDIGTAIFLAHADHNAETVLEMEGVAKDSTPEEQKVDTNASDILGSEPQQQRPVKISLPSDLLDIPALVSNTGDASVDAVLAASGEAAAAAEASLQSAEVEKLQVKEEDTTTIDVVLESSTVNEIVKKKEETTIAPPNPIIQAPSVPTLLKFAVPAVGVWLCGPLLSLIDTSAVGVLSGTAQQAALNPAVAVTDYAALLIAFLYTGTTNLIAASHAKGDGTDTTAETFVGALQLSAWVGAGLGALLLTFARPAVLSLLGGSGSPTVISAALAYVRIRAIGMPAAALIGSAQAASLGMQDVKSPLYVIGAAAAVNALADLLLVGRMGAAGAAWATVASQYVAAGLFWKWLSSRKVVPLTKAIMEMTTSPSKAPSTTPAKSRKSAAPSVRGFLHGKLRKREMFRPQRLKNTWKQFREYVIPVTSTQVGRVSGYVAMSHVVSSSLGTASMAAQQVIVSLFYCLTPIADALSLTAQSFVPPIADREPSPSRTAALRKTLRNMLRAGAFAGAIMTAAASCIPLVSGTFTQDPAVVQLVNKVVPLLVGVFSMHGLVLAAEGMLMGQKDLGFLGKMYGASFAVVPLCMLRLKSLASTRLSSVWQVYLGYQSFRFVAWTLRALQLQRRAERHQR